MSEQTLTYESVLDLIQKSTQEAAKEAARQREEAARQREEYAKEYARQREEAAKEYALQREEYARQREEYAKEYARQREEANARLDKMFQDVAAQQAETDKQMKETGKKISDLGSRIGEIIENMVGGDIVGQFQALNIAIKSHSRYKTFGKRGTSESGEIDVFLENGDLVILIEVKTRLTEDDIRDHIERMKKYRLYGDDKRRITGAVAGAVVPDDIIKFAHRQGLYVIVQSGEAVEIVAPPEGFKATEW